MAIDAASTFEDVRQAFFDNLNFDDGNGDVTKARAFRSACRALILFLSEESSKGSTRVRSGVNLQQVAAYDKLVTAWLAANDTTYSRRMPVYADLRQMRGRC